MSAFTTEIVEPKHLPRAAREALIDELYVSHCTVFEGVDRAAFAAYVIDSPADYTRLLIMRDMGGAVRGYCAVHGFVQTHLGRRALIIRFEIAAEKAWRRRSFAGPFIAKTLVRLAARHPNLPRYMFACFVHPSAYVALCRHTPEVWPRPGRETPPRVQALMHSLTRQFGIEAQDGIARVGWIARADPVPRRLDPLAAFYLARNPRYVDGMGLVTVMPLSGPTLARGIAHYVRARLGRARTAKTRSPRPGTTTPAVDRPSATPRLSVAARSAPDRAPARAATRSGVGGTAWRGGGSRVSSSTRGPSRWAADSRAPAPADRSVPA